MARIRTDLEFCICETKKSLKQSHKGERRFTMHEVRRGLGFPDSKIKTRDNGKLERGRANDKQEGLF